MFKDYSTYRWLQVCLGLTFVLCILSDCPFPGKNLRNGRFVYQSPEDSNSTNATELYYLRFHCFKGYKRIGPRSIICLDNQWSGVVPKCIKKKCVEPPVIENGTFSFLSRQNRRLNFGSIAVYSCDAGYVMEDETISQLTCTLDEQNNTAYWKGDVPICRKKASCPDPGVSANGDREGDCCFTDDVLRFSCNENFTLIGEEEIQCLITGNWSSGRPLCRPPGVFCNEPPPLMHGIATGDKDGDYYLPFQEVEVSCDPGYSYNAKNGILCKKDGQWENEFGTCTETVCEFPKELANGTILELEWTNRTEFPYGFELTYVCDKGYRLEKGDSWRLCDANGWTGDTAYCAAVHCPDPGVPEDGSKEGHSYEVGAKVRFQCSTGHSLVGSFERHCMPNGQWTGELTRCDADNNYCSNPGIPINGFKNSSRYDLGEIVGFGCSQGYFQVGSEARKCLPTGTWSGKETKCLGPYDFDSSVQIRDQLNIDINKKAAEQERKLQKYHEATERERKLQNTTMSKIIPVNHPGRLVFYFVFDVSGSVGKTNFHRSINFAKAIVKRIGISKSGARAGALTFSSKAEIMFLPIEYSTTEDVINALDLINYTGGGTSASSALRLVREECIPLTQAVLPERGKKSIVFILTDGRANMGGDPQDHAKLLKDAGVEIYCIGITGNVHKESLYKIASDSDKEPHVFILDNYGTLAWLIQELTNGTVDYSKCGLGLENAGNRIPKNRIMGGNKVTEPWPWMVAVYFLPFGTIDPTAEELQCGGSIINQFFILTAAHCMFDPDLIIIGVRKASEVIVKLGLTNVNNKSFVQEPEVKSFFVHPKYIPGSHDYDIAILQLSKPIEFNAHVRPICLPPSDLPEDSKLYSPLEYAFTIGWGSEGEINKPMKMSEHLNELILPIQSKDACMQMLTNRQQQMHFTDRMFCAGDGFGGKDTCKGDSGGPIMQAQLHEEGYLYWTQVGVVSWGPGCGVKNTYGFYSHVSNLRPWVDQQMKKAIAEKV